MKKYLFCFCAVLFFGVVGCGDPKVDKKAENLLAQDKNGNFVLYVSNQSFAISPVDIAIYINGDKAISSEFEVKGQHHWVRHIFSLQPGKHKLKIVSKKGEATLEKEIEVKGKHWAAIDYWYYPKKDGKKHFTFGIQDKPIYFE
jgi:hypothetical protein